MTVKDVRGHNLSGANDASAELYGKALRQLNLYQGDPVATIDAALAESPGFVMAHAMRAWLHLLGTEPAGFEVAEESHLRVVATATTDREKGHAAAIGALMAGNWHHAGRILEDVTLACPHDGLALIAGHQIDFFTGNARMLRDRIARALPAGTPLVQASTRCSACRPLGWRRPVPMPPPSELGGKASTSSRGTAGRTTRSPT
jgi:hypothetical protein